MFAPCLNFVLHMYFVRNMTDPLFNDTVLSTAMISPMKKSELRSRAVSDFVRPSSYLMKLWRCVLFEVSGTLKLQ